MSCGRCNGTGYLPTGYQKTAPCPACQEDEAKKQLDDPVRKFENNGKTYKYALFCPFEDNSHGFYVCLEKKMGDYCPCEKPCILSLYCETVWVDESPWDSGNPFADLKKAIKSIGRYATKKCPCEYRSLMDAKTGKVICPADGGPCKEVI